MPGCPSAILDCKAGAAVQAAQAHDALILDPDRLFIPHFNGLHRALLDAESAANAAILHMKMGGSPYMVIIKGAGRSAA